MRTNSRSKDWGSLWALFFLVKMVREIYAPYNEGSANMMQFIAAAIIVISMSVYMYIEENAQTRTQEEYDNTDWNAYYANL